MRLLKHYKSFLVFAGFLVFCSIMVIRQIDANNSRHVKLREAFILLEARGYKPQAQHLYQKLLNDLQHAPTKSLLEDFQRTLTLIDPSRKQPENLIWSYHWTVCNELEKRSEATLKQAIKLAEEP